MDDDVSPVVGPGATTPVAGTARRGARNGGSAVSPDRLAAVSADDEDGPSVSENESGAASSAPDRSGDDAGDEGDLVSEPLPSHVRRVCCRLPQVDSRARWVIAGPVNDHLHVDPLQFTQAVVVEGLPDFSVRETYARAVPILIKKGMYTSIAATYESMLHVSQTHEASPAGASEPSWVSYDVGGGALPMRRILDRASVALKNSARRVARGFVKLVGTVPLPTHPWYAYRMKLLGRRDQRRGAVAYRRAMSRMTDEEERRMLRAGNCSTLSSVRHATTYVERTPAERAKGLRPTKKRPWRGVAVPDVIPARKRLVGLKRRVFERCSRVGHAMITFASDGTTVSWEYVKNSGLTGVRLYKSPDGTVKRLASHSHKQRKLRVGIGQGSDPGLSVGEGSQPPAEGVPLEEDLLGDCLLGDEPSTQDADWRLSPDQLRVLKCSSLEKMDGSDPEVIVAVEFDIVTALRAAILARTMRCTAEDLRGEQAAWSLASDGGPIRRSAITLFTLTLSAPWLVSGRTTMLPVLYILGGEHQVHSALGLRLDALVAEALAAAYDVRVHTSGGLQDKDPSDENATDSGDADDGEQNVYSWRGPYLVRIVGDFSMIAHIMALTGGNDDSRCPFSWPCVADSYLSLTAQTDNPGRPRTAADVSLQWELACWILARWCSLRGGLLALDGGHVTVKCTSCGTGVQVQTPYERRVQCRAEGCENRLSDAFPPVLQTPLGTMFNLLRRRAGGVRGYPIIRSVPVILQVPVLHCTGNVMKKLTFFFLAELGEGVKARAKKGIYDVTGRASVGSLYLREHIKLVALLLACEDIVSVRVDSAILTMWSLALLMTASWRAALAGPLPARNLALAVMELAAGMLAPLWSSLKPLDKEKKSAGVASLYIHAALAHARDSMGDRSPAEAVLTDDHVEGQIREMSRHTQTRVNNVSRAQAVTEMHALGDDHRTASVRGRFGAELRIYTENVRVCSCCTTMLHAATTADMTKAVERAGGTGDISVHHADAEEGTPLTLSLPGALLYNQVPVPNEQGPQPWMSKERKVSHALADKLRTLHVCVCGAARGRERGSLAHRLDMLRTGRGERSSSSASLPREADAARATAPAACAVPAAPGTAHPSVALDDARSWMLHHDDDCAAVRGGDCDGSCGQQNNGLVDAGSDDVLVADWVARNDSVVGADSGDELVKNWTPRNHARGEAATNAECDAVDVANGQAGGDFNGADRADVAVDVPLLASDVLRHPVLVTSAPPLSLLKHVLAADGCTVESADADVCRARILEEDMLLRMFLVRLQEPSFTAIAAANNIDEAGMREAVTSVLHKLDTLRATLPGADGFTL